jgi:hypothetical protein
MLTATGKGLDMSDEKFAIPTALCTITRKYGNEGWFAGISAYGQDCVIIYYKNTKNIPQGSGRFRKFAGVRVVWKKVA